MKHVRALGAAVALAAATLTALPAASAAGGHHSDEPTLVGRAVLPVDTYAPGPPSGAAVASANGYTFPTPSQPVEGFSAVIDGGRNGRYLAMPDNGFGGKANSKDFLIRAYYVDPEFKTARGGDGSVDVGSYIEFRDPNHKIGFAIVNDTTRDRLLTGGDIDPESLQRAPNGDLWVGDEFGPWLLHFDRRGVLVEAPFAMPGGLRSPNNPFLATGEVATQPNSRGIEALAVSTDGRYLYAALEGATVADTAAGATSRRHIFEFSLRDRRFTGRQWEYRTGAVGNMVSDLAALDRHHLVLIERDGGLGPTALDRKVNLIDLRRTDIDGYVGSTMLVDLANIADPALVSLPPLHEGDIRLGDPFGVVCESIEAIHPVGRDRLLLGCDNNLPNTGRNPKLADDNEFILVEVPALR